MKKKRFRILSVAMVAVLGLGLLAGCGKKEAPAEEPTTESTEANGANEAGETTEANEAATKNVFEMSEEELIEAAKAEGSVTFAVWHDEALWREIGEGFTEKYGIKFDVAMGEKQALTNKVLAEKESAKGSIDVMKIGGEDVATTIAAQVFMGPTLPHITAKDELDQKLSVRQEGVEHGGYLVPLHRNQTGLLINPERVTNPPQTWAELEAWIEENPKQFGFCNPSEGGSGQAMVFSAIGNVLDGYDRYEGDDDVVESKTEDWDQVWQWFNDRKDKVTITQSNKDSLSRLNQGELTMVVAWDDQTTATIKAGELFKDAKLYIPEFGLPGGGDSAGIVANSQNPAAALLLLNYMTSEECQKQLNEVLNTYPARTDVDITNTSINADDFVNRTDWIAAGYKEKFIADFVSNVLMTN